MLSVFNSVTPFWKYASGVKIVNFTCWLQKVTAILLMATSILISSRVYIEKPIDCTIDAALKKDVETFCWTQGTFITMNDVVDVDVDSEIPYPGTGPQKRGDEIFNQGYFIWLCFALFVQSLLFFICCSVCWEFERQKRNKVPGLTNDQESPDRCRMIVQYFDRHLHRHSDLVVAFFVIEIINLAHVIGQFFIMNYILGGKFLTYGSEALATLSMAPSAKSNFLEKVFPRVGKCTYYQFSPFGSVQPIDTQCFLPQSYVNRLIFAFFWLWLVSLAIVSFLTIIYRLAMKYSRPLRVRRLLFNADFDSRGDVESVEAKCHLGDLFLLVIIKNNTEPSLFREIINQLAATYDV